MSVKSCEKIEKSQVVLTIEVGAPEFEAAIEKAYQKMRKKINVPGFRPGKAPRKIIEGMYGAEVFFEEAINIAFPEAYEAAVKEQELQVVGYPSVEIEGQVTRDGFTFKATAPVYPEVTLGQYKGLSAPKEEVKVSAADVDERLKALTDRNTRLVSVDREAKEGDTVVIDFEGFLEGKPFEGGKGENFSLELGSHTFVPGFEEQLVGVKAGDEKDLDITFPEDYHKDLAGKAVVFKVKVHEVKEKEIPALDDEFAKDVSEFDTLKDLKADLKKKITAEREETVKRAFEDALMEQVAENITADVPDAMVEAQSRQFLDNFKMQLAQQGLQYDQYMKATGMDEAQLLADAKAVIEHVREARADELLEKLGDTAPHGGGSTDLSAIGLALVERKVRALFVAEGAYIPGGFDEETGEVFLFEREPHGRFQGPELADAFARAALAQDAEVFELAPEKIPGDSGMAALYRY